MLSVQRLRELFSTLRFRLVLWITVVVFVMVVVTNFSIREVETLTLRHSYDQLLKASVEEMASTLVKFDLRLHQQLTQDQRERSVDFYQNLWKEKVRANEHRALFVQIFDGNQRLIFSSENAPEMDSPAFEGVFHQPFDEQEHRVIEKNVTAPSGEHYFVRCGFRLLVLQAEIDLLNRYILLFSLSILLAAPLGGYVIALVGTRPIAQIIATTAHLQPSNMNERLPIRGTGDEIDQLSQTINGMLDRLASYIDHNREFVANAAHELRSPLAAIRSSVEVGLNKSRDPEEYAAILADVTEEIGRLAGLVNRLLILAEGDAGRMTPREQTARLDKIVRESVDMFEAVAESKGVRLTLGDIAPAVVPGDESYLRQVVRNLIDNAIKYNRNPGSVHVHLRATPPSPLGRGVGGEGKQAFLIVSDTGIGMDAQVLPRIFERFYRADKSRTRENERAGYGLGLSICQTIVRALGGDITVTSEPDRGTTFVVRLPLLADQSTLPLSSDRLLATAGR